MPDNWGTYALASFLGLAGLFLLGALVVIGVTALASRIDHWRKKHG